MTFKRLEDLRIDADKTQKQIADVLVCKREVYRRYEKGEHQLPVWAAIKLAEYYKTSTDYIFGRTDMRNPYPPPKGERVPAKQADSTRGEDKAI